MKCVVENTNLHKVVVVFETNKITSMAKIDYPGLCSYSISIYFDNGARESFEYDSVAKREEEWQRIMRCWRSDENDGCAGSLTVGD